MIQQRGRGVVARRASLLVLALLLADAEALAADPPASQPPLLSQAEQPAIDEVVVLGKKLDEMRTEIFKADDRFYALYNELNTNHDYDVHCADEAPLGSRFKRRVCRPVFQDKAQEAEGRAFVEGHKPSPAEMVVEMLRDDYRKNVREVVKKNPQLLQLLRERYEMVQRYQKARQEQFKGHRIPFE